MVLGVKKLPIPPRGRGCQKKIFARVKVAQRKPHFFTAKSNVTVSGPGKIFGAKNIAMVCANEKIDPRWSVSGCCDDVRERRADLRFFLPDQHVFVFS